MEPANDVMLPKEAAKYMGVSLSTFWRWAYRKDNPLPYIRLDVRTVRVLRSKLLKWLEEKAI